MPISPSVVAGPTPEPAVTPASTRFHRRTDLLAVLAALALATWVTSGLWAAPNGRAITVNSGDQALFEWLLAYGAHALTHGENPLFTYLLNVPDGVNLAVNTSITVYAAVFAPLTYLIGPPATFLVVLTLNLAGTALAWYWFLSRHLVRSAPAALLGGLFIGFAPGMVSHANAHLNWTAGWLVPLLLWRVLRLADPGRWVRNGLLLGVLVTAAFSIAAEGLFFTALACAVFLGTWTLHPSRRTEVRAALPVFLRGLALAGAVAAGLLTYPLWLHFLGPQRFHGTGFDPVIHAEDLAAYGAYPERSLAGLLGLGSMLAPNPTEENSFFGLPLLALAVGCFVLLWRHAGAGRRPTLRALGVTALVFTVLSWGPQVKILGRFIDLPLPYALLGKVPVFNAALPARLALVVAPILGILLAHTMDLLRVSGQHHDDPVGTSPELGRGDRTRGDRLGPGRGDGAPGRRAVLGWSAGFLVALLPLVPAPLRTVEREPIPAFITSGAWRDHVTLGGVLAPLPFTLDLTPDGQRWQAYALAHRQGEFAIPSGFFLGPGGPDGRGRIGPVPRRTDALLLAVAETGEVPVITDADRAAARADLRHWRVEAVVLADRVHGSKFPIHVEAVRRAATELFGPPERVADVWLWQVPLRFLDREGSGSS